jgi:hypothetical protein
MCSPALFSACPNYSTTNKSKLNSQLICTILSHKSNPRDDDYVTEMGFLPTPPGNFSIMSSALAIFRLSKVLSRLLGQVYAPQRVSLSTIQSIENELNDWRNSLPGYLRVDLHNCIPSSSNFHSHASMLLLLYHWMRTLIHRPILASTLLKKDETIKATVSLSESSRAIISILSVLNEKNVQVNICLSPDFILWSSCISVQPFISKLTLDYGNRTCVR